MLAKLQEKNRIYKKLAENAEEMATANLARLRRAQVSEYNIIGPHFSLTFLKIKKSISD